MKWNPCSKFCFAKLQNLINVWPTGLSPYGGVPTRIGIGDTMASASQGYGHGNLVSDAYYGAANRYPMGGSAYSVLNSGPGALGYLAHSPNYQSLSYANPMSALMNRGYAYGFGPQFLGQPYQSSPFGAYNGYNNYNNYNSNGITSGGLTQGGITDGIRDEKSYASSASTQTETHSDGQSSNDSPVFESSRMGRRVDHKTRRMFSDHKMIE